ncbi:4-alpha-glucanotransferase [Chitinophaga polysaccharea]|uniref:4-alpha-glucanotransferase n=1 Tax=Chitinophaga polysaccharea TaxID=1293035 RepID=UPI00145598BC|nr:4-alpha-glucanotransferase [Chitinophaga polysaccharea]NLR57255.1 4-alpha-glucanotransferase [Chitinophaga polysaccharea]
MSYRLRFYLRYRTYYGQNLYLLGNLPALGNDVPKHAHAMRWLNEDWWYTDIQLAPGETFTLQYQYLVRELEEVRYEGQVRACMVTPGSHQEIVFTDTWNDASRPENAWLTAPFSRVFFKRQVASVTALNTATHIFRVQAPLLDAGKTICLLGSSHQTGNWNTAQPLLLQYDAQGWFFLALQLSGVPVPLSYKYGIYDLEAKRFLYYEDGEDRQLQTVAIAGRQVILHDGILRIQHTPWKGAGVAIPVFSLRSAEGFGTGEFADLPQLAAWAQRHHLQLIQVLPVNDTIQTNTWKDSYPYAAISSFALHPQYIRLQEVGVLPDQHPLQRQFGRLRQWLNEKETVDYETVMSFKLAYLHALYEHMGAQLQTPDYWQWFAANEYWLLPYAAFCYLREQYKTSDFSQWPEYNVYDYTAISRLLAGSDAATSAAHYHFFVQYHLHRQLAAATAAIHQHGVALKGDIPIGVARHSVDTWMHPAYYHLDMQTGAPPDGFTATGQNWGFPTWNWKQMATNGLEWWQQRLRHMSVYFDAFRIDHILGFFRIWQIPADAIQGLLGYFHPAIPVSREEIRQRGIDFDEDRYCQPYITQAILEEAFGNYAGIMKDKLMVPLGDGRYQLLPEFNTQRKVAAAALPEAVKHILFHLIADVLFIRVTDRNRTLYHPRYDMAATRSFAALGKKEQDSLSVLYHDYFYVRQESCWRKEAMHKLPLIKRATNMLICGEDLGMVPDCVPGVMQALGILSLEVERMPKSTTDNFTDLNKAPYLSVLTPDTHDMSTLRGWWEEDCTRSREYYLEQLRQAGTAPTVATPALLQQIITRHIQAPAMWRIFQLQDLLAAAGHHAEIHPDAERINIPAVASHYWRYRIAKPINDY